MLRTAATLLGLAVVALSIGFNTMRYPLVWEMAGSARTSEAAQSVAAVPSERPENPVPGQPPQLVPAPSAGRLEVKPIPEATDRIAVDKSSGAEANALPDPHLADEAATAVPDTQKPLVPVVAASLSAASRGGMVLSPGVRRLPPVESANSDPASRGSGAPPAVRFRRIHRRGCDASHAPLKALADLAARLHPY